jgi:hypothetical protein
VWIAFAGPCSQRHLDIRITFTLTSPNKHVASLSPTPQVSLVQMGLGVWRCLPFKTVGPTYVATTPLSLGNLQHLYRVTGFLSIVFPKRLPGCAPTQVEAGRARLQRLHHILAWSRSSEVAYTFSMLKRTPTPELVRKEGATRIFQLQKGTHNFCPTDRLSERPGRLTSERSYNG